MLARSRGLKAGFPLRDTAPGYHFSLLLDHRMTDHPRRVTRALLSVSDKSGLIACRELLKVRPQPKILVLTSSSNERNVQEALSAGAQGYLLKDNDGASLARALRLVAGGQPVIDPSMAGQMLNLVKHRGEMTAAGRLSQLSPQERRVVAYLAEGLTNKEIGDRLGLTEKTIKNYLATVFSKLNIARRSQAAALFVEAGKSDDV